MRCRLWSIAAVVLCGQSAWAQHCATAPNCASPPCPQPCPTERYAPPEEGVYVAPPPTGVRAAETASGAFDLGAIHFPALSLRLPTIQLPACFAVRRDAQMYVDSNVAAFHRGPTEVYGRADQPRNAPPPTDRNIPGCTQPPARGCTGGYAMTEQSLAEDEREMLRMQNALLEQKLAAMQACVQRLEQHVDSLGAQTAPAPQDPTRLPQTTLEPVHVQQGALPPQTTAPVPGQRIFDAVIRPSQYVAPVEPQPIRAMPAASPLTAPAPRARIGSAILPR